MFRTFQFVGWLGAFMLGAAGIRVAILVERTTLPGYAANVVGLLGLLAIVYGYVGMVRWVDALRERHKQAVTRLNDARAADRDAVLLKSYNLYRETHDLTMTINLYEMWERAWQAAEEYHHKRPGDRPS